MRYLANFWQIINIRLSSFRRFGQITALSVSVYYLAYSLQKFAKNDRNFDWNWRYLLLAWWLIFAAVWIGAVGWWLILRALGINRSISLGQAVTIHLKSNLAKYIPGYVWQFIGKAYFTYEKGVTIPQLSVAMILELITVLGSGVGLAGLVSVFVPFSFIQNAETLIRIFGLFFFIILLVMPIVLRIILYFMNIGLNVNIRAYGLALLVMMSGWLCLGLGLWALTSMLLLMPLSFIPYFLVTTVLVFFASFVVIFAPNGLGVRESAIVFLLSSTIGADRAVLVAILLRIFIIISELVAFFVVFWLAKYNIGKK